MKRTREGEMTEVTEKNKVQMNGNGTINRTLIPSTTLEYIEHLLDASVRSAQFVNELPQHEWTPFTVSVMTSPREATHYTSTIIKNIHAFRQAHGLTTGPSSKAKKSRKKRKIKNDKGEWVTVYDDTTGESTNEPSTGQNSSDAADAPSTMEVDSGNGATGADASSAAAASSSSGASAAASISADAYSWAQIIGRHFQKLLAEESPDAIQLRRLATVTIDIPPPDASIRGGGFIDFVIRPIDQPLLAGYAAPETSNDLPISSMFDNNTAFSFASIGTIDSVFKLKYGTPRQGTIAPNSRGSLTLHPSIPESSLDGLEEYSHIWIVFIFHRNENKIFRPKIEPPRALGKKLGVFATRTPHRVNPIGLSLVKLDRIEGRTLYLSSLDLIQGTPVIDIKPYHPADSIPSTDFSIPQWMAEQNAVKPPFIVSWSQAALEELAALFSTTASPSTATSMSDAASSTQSSVKSQQYYLEFLSSYSAAKDAIEECVSLDPRPIYIRERANVEEVYGYRLDRLNILYRIDDGKKLAHIEAVQYIDYERILAEKHQEEGGTGSAIKKLSNGKRITTLTSEEEEYITKKFLEQRPKKTYPLNHTEQAPLHVSLQSQ